MSEDPIGYLTRRLGLTYPKGEVTVPPDHQPYYGEETADTEGSQSFQVPNGSPLDQRTSFVCGSVIIDNNTSSYLNVPDATKDGTGRWVPPGFGAAFPILGHISRARINWSAPPGKTQPAGLPNEQATVVFFAAPVPPGFGFAAPSNQTLPWITPTKQLRIEQSLAINGTAILQAGAVGQIIYLFDFTGTIDAAVAAGWYKFRDTTLSQDFGPEFGTVIIGPQHVNFGGVPMTQGSALGILNSGAGAILLRGGIFFNQL